MLHGKGTSYIIAVALGIWLSACASKPTHTVKMDSRTPLTEQISNVDSQLVGLKNANADVLAPTPYEKAQKADDRAKRLSEKKGSDQKDALQEIAKARAFVADALSQSQLAHDRLSSVLESRRFAMNANAQNLFPSRWKDAEASLERTAYSVRERPEEVSDKVVDLDRRYISLEKDAVAKTHLDPARQTLEKARKEGAATYAPRSLKEAQLQFDQSLAAIRGSPRNELEVEQASKLAQQKADFALEVSRRAQASNVKGGEDLIRANIAQEEAAKRADELSMQAMDQRNAALTEREQAEQRAAALEATLANTPVDDTNEKVEQVRKMFGPNEAEVYTQGDNLLIRLKGLRFASGQAQVSSAQYPILGKVADAIAIFDSGKVVVEGHTDSTGSAATNRQLSKERAENVRSYLLSIDGDLEGSEVTAEGYGDEKPIANNKTNDGRAMNRRIDVMIEMK